LSSFTVASLVRRSSSLPSPSPRHSPAPLFSPTTSVTAYYPRLPHTARTRVHSLTSITLDASNLHLMSSQQGAPSAMGDMSDAAPRGGRDEAEEEGAPGAARAKNPRIRIQKDREEVPLVSRAL
jgi:hypothetical protein